MREEATPVNGQRTTDNRQRTTDMREESLEMRVERLEIREVEREVRCLLTTDSSVRPLSVVCCLRTLSVVRATHWELIEHKSDLK